MGFDLEAQHSFTAPGAGRAEVGYADISSDSATVEVPTRLLTCYFGMGISDTDTTNGNNVLVFTTDCSVSNSAITFKRAGPLLEEDVRFRYLVFGW